jgi:hypothetical protein
MSGMWPTTDLDPVRRLRVLAAAIPGASVTERVMDAPWVDVWRILSDLDGGFTAIQPDMSRLHVELHEGSHVVALVRSRFGMRARLTGVLKPGWCWLQSRFLLIGMAVTPEPGGGTRVALTGGVRVPGRAAIIPIGVRRESRRSLQRLADLLE